jgi:hypothetical protein
MSRYAVRQLFSLGLSIVIFGSLALLFLDDAPQLPEAPNPKMVQYVGYSYDQIAGRGSKKKFTLSADWVSYYFTELFKKNQTGQEGDSTLLHKEAIFEFYDENKIRIDLRSRLNSFGIEKDITCSVVLSFAETDTGIGFNVESAAHGMAPLIGKVGAARVVYPRFESLILENDDLDKMLGRIKSLSIADDGKLSITLK